MANQFDENTKSPMLDAMRPIYSSASGTGQLKPLLIWLICQVPRCGFPSNAHWLAIPPSAEPAASSRDVPAVQRLEDMSVGSVHGRRSAPFAGEQPHLAASLDFVASDGH